MTEGGTLLGPGEGEVLEMGTARIEIKATAAGTGGRFFLSESTIRPGLVHTFSNPGETPVRFLNFNIPGGWEEYMRALSKSGAEGPLTASQIGEIAARYDFKPV